jgi:hypothetical protein
VAAGTAKPYHTFTSKPGRPVSFAVGTSGACGWRFSAVSATARSFPERTCVMTLEKLSHMSGTRPARTSCIAGAGPL